MDAIKQLASDRRTRDRIEGRRDGLILEARLAGETWPVIANAVGLTELATRNAAKRANGGLLPDAAPTRAHVLAAVMVGPVSDVERARLHPETGE